jgi:hypothetical protein
MRVKVVHAPHWAREIIGTEFVVAKVSITSGIWAPDGARYNPEQLEIVEMASEHALKAINIKATGDPNDLDTVRAVIEVIGREPALLKAAMGDVQ